MRRFFALCSGELSGFSAPPDASALDVFKAALSAGQSNGVVRAFSEMMGTGTETVSSFRARVARRAEAGQLAAAVAEEAAHVGFFLPPPARASLAAATRGTLVRQA